MPELDLDSGTPSWERKEEKARSALRDIVQECRAQITKHEAAGEHYPYHDRELRKIIVRAEAGLENGPG
jgi:hypothetical protein